MIMANELIKDHHRAQAYFDEMVDQIKRDIEGEVADGFRELRRLAPYGVDEGDFQGLIHREIRRWLPREGDNGKPIPLRDQKDSAVSGGVQGG